MRFLITGFDPFGGEDINPSWEVVRSLPDNLGEIEIVKRQIPTVFGESYDSLKSFWDETAPDVVIAVGQAGGRASLSVERIAINRDDARIEDNRGNRPIDQPVRSDGENAYFSNLPVKAMVQAIISRGVPASLSNTAGTFVCNHIMYAILHRISREFPGVRGGFIHVPYLPGQTAGKGELPSMSAELIRTGLIAAIEAAAINQSDLHLSMGKEC